MNAIFDAQIRKILNESLDDFKRLQIDSTSVKGNTSWPTDSRILTRLVERIYHRSQLLCVFTIETIKNEKIERIIKEMNGVSKSIDLGVRKKGAKKKRNKAYKELLKHAKRAYGIFIKELKRIDGLASEINIKPTQEVKLIRVLELRKVTQQIRENLME